MNILKGTNAATVKIPTRVHEPSSIKLNSGLNLLQSKGSMSLDTIFGDQLMTKNCKKFDKFSSAVSVFGVLATKQTLFPFIYLFICIKAQIIFAYIDLQNCVLCHARYFVAPILFALAVFLLLLSSLNMVCQWFSI